MRAEPRELVALAWPVVVSRATQTVVGLADAVMVSHLGPSALAATTTGANNAFTLLILPMAMTFIVQSFAAQMMGRGDALAARRFGVYGLVLAAATQLVALIAIPLLPAILGMLDFEADVREQMENYLLYRLMSAGAAIGLEALGAYYGGLGRPRLPMVANVFAMVLNVALCALLIDGRWGAPALGVSGSAIASSIATGLAFVGLFSKFLAEGPWPEFRGPEFIRVLRFGTPSGLNWFMEFFAWNFFINVVMPDLGTSNLAALMAVMQINSVSFMPAFGLASAGAILVGQAIGRNERDEVPRIVGMTFRLAAVWQGSVGAAYLFVPALLFSPFASQPESREAMMSVGITMLMLSSGWQLFDAAAGVLTEALRAAGDTLVPLLIRLSLAWLLWVPVSWILVRVFHVTAPVALATLLGYLALLAGATFLRYRSGAWRRMELIEPSV